MEMSPIVQWITDTFSSFDFNILQFYANLHEGPLGAVLDVFFLFYTHLGDDGIFFIVLGLIFLLFKKTRKVGLGMLVGIIVGALITNVTIKPLIARPRPFELLEYSNDPTIAVFREWWINMGEVHASSMRSFPSGHTTSAVAALVPVFMFCNKKYSWLALVAAVLMGASRNYVMVHYPSDVLGGIIVGAVAGLVAFFVISFVMNKLAESSKPALNKVATFDLIDTIKAKKNNA